ncbi:hypothetical protein Celaphus_00012761 [Cervus elaphus hippelaphus]|uniref:Uncharacterized protein n=1 Tax=Cervus elaphus hippelaphus TaxID=46360 RepID=A0A212CIA2_CEREH|nr:hypothetical protein Celaphus_00012761 [Cervus elaphus hippelaphus]
MIHLVTEVQKSQEGSSQHQVTLEEPRRPCSPFRMVGVQASVYNCAHTTKVLVGAGEAGYPSSEGSQLPTEKLLREAKLLHGLPVLALDSHPACPLPMFPRHFHCGGDLGGMDSPRLAPKGPCWRVCPVAHPPALSQDPVTDMPPAPAPAFKILQVAYEKCITGLCPLPQPWALAHHLPSPSQALSSEPCTRKLWESAWLRSSPVKAEGQEACPWSPTKWGADSFLGNPPPPPCALLTQAGVERPLDSIKKM